MAGLDFCSKYNMVAYLEKNDGNTEFHQIMDFLTNSSIHFALIVTAQAAKIKDLKAQIKQLKKKARPIINHHKVWFRAARLKKQQKQKDMEKSNKRRSVSKKGRKAVKSSKGAPSVQTNTDWDALDTDLDETINEAMDYTLAQDEGKTDSKVEQPKTSSKTKELHLSSDTFVVEDKGSAKKRGSTKGIDLQQSTDKPDEGTDKQDESTNKLDVNKDQHPLTLLVKPGGGIRPIVVDGLQFNIRLAGKSEAILHSVNRLIEACRDDVGLLMLLVDFKNAFNLVDREVMLREVHLRCPTITRWVELCYSNPARLDSFSLSLHAWYLDDGTIVGDTVVVGKVLELIMEDGLGHGLHLNVDKTEVFYFDFGNELVMKRVAKTIRLMDVIAKINDPQCELMLLHSCTGFSNWKWRLATLPFAFEGLGVYSAGDVLNYAFLASRLQSARLQTKLLQHIGIVSLRPILDDALSVFNTSIEIDLLSNPSEIAAPKLMKKMANIYFTRVTKNAESTFSLSPQQIALWISQKEDHTSDWYPFIFCFEALFSVFIGDIYGDYVVSCAGIIGIKHRHNVVRDTLVDICYRSGISAGKEVDIGFDGGHDKPLRPADMLLYSWDGGLDVCVDLTSSPLTQTGMVDFVHGRAVIDAAQCKRGKYMAKCATIRYRFLPFSFSSFGELEAGVVTLLKRIRKFSMAQDIQARVAIHIFNKISFAIAKGGVDKSDGEEQLCKGGARMNKLTGVGASGAACDGIPKISNSSHLVSPTVTISMPRGLYSVDVAATFGVPLTTTGDLHMLIKGIEAGKHDELLSAMTNDERMEIMDALDDSTIVDAHVAENLNVNESTMPMADPVFAGVNISIPRKVVKKEQLGETWAKRIMMNTKGFFLFKFDSRASLEAVLEGGPWLIRNSSIIINKWSMDTRLLKEELTRIPIWVKLHNVPIQVFEEYGISLIATFIRKPVMLDSYISSMCNDSWGRSSFARCLIKVNSEADLVDVVTIGIPSLTGDGFTKETIRVKYEWKPPKCDICKIFGHVHNHCSNKVVSPPIVTTSNVVTPIVEKTNDGFQTETTSEPKKGATNVGNPSTLSSMLKTTGTSFKKDIIPTSNSYSALNAEEEEEEEDVENMYDETANLFTKTGGSSSTAAAG
ncbi:putative reverse transcriptase domain-containing protein [Tanacetum coccineum]